MPAGPEQIDPHTGLMLRCRQVLSPHFDERPPGSFPELIILHGISLPPDDYGGPFIDQLFCGNLPRDAHPYFAGVADARVSAHLLITREAHCVQYVPFGDRAWHAGASAWNGRKACNDFSIGIELEGSDHVPYEDAQYATLARVIEALLRTYPSLARDRIVGHSDVAPGRKSDPGLSFDWQRLRASLAGAREQQP